MNHKRHRPKRQRAGCNCGGKLAKNEGATRKGTFIYGSRGSELRLIVRMREARP